VCAKKNAKILSIWTLKEMACFCYTLSFEGRKKGLKGKAKKVAQVAVMKKELRERGAVV